MASQVVTLCRLLVNPFTFASILLMANIYQYSCGLPNATVDGRIYGWVEQANTRGTMGILWTNLFTIFVSTYVILCLNVPSRDESSWKILCRHLFWMGLAIAGPEFVLTYASGQWGTASDSVRDFHSLGHRDWTLRHGFFADMGGFLLVPPKDTPSCTPFPITAKHLHWLVKNDYLPYPETTTLEIRDKSKQDTLAKIITCFQIGYLILQCVGRAAQGLEITTLELFSLAIVACSIMTSFCWLRKPVNVLTPVKLHMRQTVEEIWKDHNESGQWKQTPLDFIDDLGPSWALNVQPFMKMEVSPFERPIPRFGNDRLPNLNGRQEIILCFTTLAYAAIHLAGWRFSFPTRTEKILWRVSSMFLFGNTVAFWVCETSAAWYRVGRWQRTYYRLFAPKKLQEYETERLRRLEDHVPKVLPLPWEFWSIFPLAITYAAARGYLIVEAFVGLRSLEASAYLEVNWSSFFPHV